MQPVVEYAVGLKDCKGKDIYQGDILRFDLKAITHGPERETGEIGEVWYDVEDATWAIGRWEEIYSALGSSLERRFSWYYQFSDRIDRATMEVIGNVWENGELLK